MTKIFGQEAEHEMLSVNNGLLMSTLAENKMDKGLFVIVPYANDESETDVREWNLSHPKRLKIRVLDKSHKERVCSRWFQPQIQKSTGRSWTDVNSNFSATTGLEPAIIVTYIV